MHYGNSYNYFFTSAIIATCHKGATWLWVRTDKIKAILHSRHKIQSWCCGSAGPVFYSLVAVHYIHYIQTAADVKILFPWKWIKIMLMPSHTVGGVMSEETKT